MYQVLLFNFRRHICKGSIELMTLALTWCANIFVGCSVTPTFFRQITSLSDSFHYTKKQKKICAWEVLIISYILLKWIQDTGVCDLQVLFFKAIILADLMTYVAKIYQIGLYKPC